MPIFLLYAPKHRFWVLVRNAKARRPSVYSQSMLLVKIRKITKTISTENLQFLQLNNLSILHGHVFLMLLYNTKRRNGKPGKQLFKLQNLKAATAINEK